jgi:hypothetical protein
MSPCYAHACITHKHVYTYTIAQSNISHMQNSQTYLHIYHCTEQCLHVRGDVRLRACHLGTSFGERSTRIWCFTEEWYITIWELPKWFRDAVQGWRDLFAGCCLHAWYVWLYVCTDVKFLSCVFLCTCLIVHVWQNSEICLLAAVCMCGSITVYMYMKDAMCVCMNACVPICEYAYIIHA